MLKLEGKTALVTGSGSARVEAVSGDLTRTSDLARLFESIPARAGRLDILVNSSGVAEHASLEVTTEELSTAPSA